MKFKYKIIFCAVFLLLIPVLRVSAVSMPGGSNGGGAPGPPTPPPTGIIDGEFSGGITVPGGEDSDPIEGEIEGEFDGTIIFPYPNYSTYYPKVTSLKSVNALLAESGESVYFLPVLEDFPVDLETTVSDLTDGRGKKHRFAVVYDGYFDNDVLLQADTPYDADNSRVHTSKKVYSMDYNSRLCNYLGYDILLRDEKYYMDSYPEARIIYFRYNATRVNNSILDTQTMIMDLYKAMGVYEWDIEFAYGIDEDFDANTSPILQKIGVLTTDKNKGFNTSESYTWVAATRTNPDLYWLRCERDLIFDGGAHLYDGNYWGNEVSVSGSFSRDYTPTLGEFCAMARAIMSLYGEPVLTQAEIQACIEAYGLYIPETAYHEDIYNALIYLAAKGILDPEGKDFNSTCTFDDIEDILLRIADKDSRLTVKTPVWNVLASRGFQQIENCVAARPGVQYLEMQSSELPYYDLLIEVKPGFTEYMTYSSPTTTRYTYGTYTSNGDVFNDIDEQHVGMITSTDITDFTNQEGLGYAALNATGITIGVVLGGGSQTYEEQIGFPSDPDMVLNRGIVTFNNKQYYHIQYKVNEGFGGVGSFKLPDGNTVNTDQLQHVFTYRVSGEDNVVRRDPNLQGYRETHSGDKVFTLELPNIDGGVYNVTDNGTVEYLTFAEAGFDDSFRCKDTEIFNTPGLTTYASSNTLISLTFPMDGSISQEDIINAANPATQAMWRNVLTNKGQVFQLNQYTKAYARDVAEINEDGTQGAGFIRMEFYCTDGGDSLKKDDGYVYIQKRSQLTQDADNLSMAFYRAESGSLLVSESSLIDSGVLASVTKLSDSTYLIAVNGSSASMATNVTLHYVEDERSNFICIGNTMYPCNTMDNPREILFEEVDGELYFNYRALMGWGSEVVIMPMTPDGVVFAYTTQWLCETDRGTYNATKESFIKPTFTQQSIRQLMPSSSVYTYRMKVNPNYNKVGDIMRTHTVDGLSLLSSYPLASYLMVAGPTDAVTRETTDYLFTWHIKGTNSETASVDDSAARAKFADLIGSEVPAASDTYYMSCLALSREAHWNPWSTTHPVYRHTSQNVSSFTYARRIVNNKRTGTLLVDFGWIYTPPHYNDPIDAIKQWDSLTYHSDFTDEQREATLGLPIFSGRTTNAEDNKQHYFDASVNHCIDETGALLDGGILPGYFAGTDHGLTSLQSDYQLSKPDANDTTPISDYKVVPAPAGLFAAFTAGVKGELSETVGGSSAVYWGTSRLSGYNKDTQTIRIGSKGEISLSPNSRVIRTFSGTLGTTIWTIDAGAMTISSLGLYDVADVEAKILDLMPTVDLEQYKFSRLIQSLDSWSTVLLIFILNILPRVCVLLFFILLLLSLIPKTPTWRLFCARCVDPYRVLTLGHQSIDTVNTKKLIIMSSIGIVAFSIIMDGAGISVLLWVSEWLVKLFQ